MRSAGRFLSNGSGRASVFSFSPMELRYSGPADAKVIKIAPLHTTNSTVLGAVVQWMVTSGDWAQRSADEKQTGLERLRRAGISLFEKLAGGDAEWLRGLLKSISYLDVTVREWNIPWEFIYLGDATGPVDLNAFFGSNAVVGRTHESDVIPNDPGAPANDVDEEPMPKCDAPMSVALAEDISLPSALDGTERAIFDERRLPVHLLEALRGKGGLEKLEAFLERSPYLTHFNCHASEEDPTNSKIATLRLTEEFSVTRSQIAAMPVLEGSMVVLNCCSGHTLRHDFEATMATTFADRRTAAVVATTCRIVDTYATAWARLFYDSLFALKSVGDAMLAARRGMLTATGDPACLVYGLYGRYDASLRDAPFEIATAA